MASVRGAVSWMLIACLVSTSLGYSVLREEREEGEDVWQNVLEENEGEGYFEGDIIPDVRR